jgi:hypothetical protein
MKKKALVVVLACVMALAGLFAANSAQAAYAWVSLTNLQVGGVFGNYVIVDNATSQYYVLDPTQQNALLAAALTAKSLGSINAYIDTAASGSICYGVYAQ